jgi:hypothetical protein
MKLDGLRDRIDQVAGSPIYPPPYVDSRETEDPDRPGYGCVLVSVPATGPHQADPIATTAISCLACRPQDRRSTQREAPRAH